MALASFDINIWAVIVSAVIYFLIGMAWYSQKLFGKQWMTLMEISEAKMKGAMKKGMAGKMVTALFTSFVLALILAWVISMSGASLVGEGLWAGFLVWLGFVATIELGIVLWHGKPVKLYLINACYYLVSFLVMSLVLTVWV